MFKTIKQVFVGTSMAEKANLKDRLHKWEFKGNWFKFLTGFAAIVSKLSAINGISSYKDLSLLLLNNIPATYAMLKFTLKASVEAAAQDVIAVYTHVMDTLTSFAIDAGLYSITEKKTNR